MSNIAAVSSEFVRQQRREYALYSLSSKTMPSFADGLIKGARRNIWKARDGKKYKTETLAGITMSLHPHGESSSIVNNLTGGYVNNFPLFTGSGCFGTRITPDGFGAPRYTSVELSEFSKDVLLVDLNLVPMIPNYDETEKEPQHFLPLVPIGLLNPIEGISLGYSTRILPRDLADVIKAQLAVLKNPKAELETILPCATSINSAASSSYSTNKGTTYVFHGDVSITNTSEFVITKLPYGLKHDVVIKRLDELWDNGTIVKYVDESAKDIKITVNCGRGKLKGKTVEDIVSEFKLISKESEILRMLSIDESRVVRDLAPEEVIREFTEWRVTWYVKRYEANLKELETDLQLYLDIRTAIDNDAGTVARSSATKNAFKTFLKGIGIFNIDYIANMSVFKFTKEEYNLNEKRIKDCEKQIAANKKVLASPALLRQAYAKELEAVLANYTNGKYT